MISIITPALIKAERVLCEDGGHEWEKVQPRSVKVNGRELLWRPKSTYVLQCARCGAIKAVRHD